MKREIPPLPAWEGPGPSDRSKDTNANDRARAELDKLARRSPEVADQEARAPEVPGPDDPPLHGQSRM